MTSENQNEAWSACETGALSSLSAQYRLQQSRQRLVKLMVGTAGGMLGGVAVMLLLLNPSGRSNWMEQTESRPAISPNLSAKMTCPEVFVSRDEYLLGHTSDEERGRIRAHLSHCAHCQAVYQQRALELKIDFSILIVPPTEQTAALFAAR